MAAEYKVKFFFADATTIEETFSPQVTVAEAKSKLIASWPEGEGYQRAVIMHMPQPEQARAWALRAGRCCSFHCEHTCATCKVPMGAAESARALPTRGSQECAATRVGARTLVARRSSTVVAMHCIVAGCSS
jgi:hypothetical protein